MRDPTNAGYAHNQGVMVGFGLGAGTTSCDNCGDSEGGLAFDFNLGGFLNPRTAVMYDLSGWYDSQGDSSLTLSTHTLAVQYWLSPVFWLKGGAGLAQASVSFSGSSDSRSGVGITGGAGFEGMQNNNFAIDLSGRINRLSIDSADFTSLNAVVGVRWK